MGTKAETPAGGEQGRPRDSPKAIARLKAIARQVEQGCPETFTAPKSLSQRRKPPLPPARRGGALGDPSPAFVIEDRKKALK